MKTKLLITSLTIFLSISLSFSIVHGQNNGSNAKSAIDTSQIVATVELEEIVLDTINIDAIIEKPRVSIVPKRLNPELGDLEFVNRSFDHELKSFPQKPLVKDDRLFKPQRIDNIAKKIVKNKNAVGKKNLTKKNDNH